MAISRKGPMSCFRYQSVSSFKNITFLKIATDSDEYFGSD